MTTPPNPGPLSQSSRELLAWTDKYKSKPVEEGAHTPMPWEHVPHAPFSIWKGDTQIASFRWYDDDGNVDRFCVQHYDMAQANAEYAVNCVNSHASLVRRNEELAGALEYYASESAKAHGYDNGALARAALANNAKGGE